MLCKRVSAPKPQNNFLIGKHRTALMALALIAVLSNQASAQGFAGDVAGPVEATVVRVVDGDTILVDALTWPQQSVRVYVRLRGIDAPELHAHCRATRAAAEEAKRVLSDFVAVGSVLRLRQVAGGKYFGRVLARVQSLDGTDLSAVLLARHLAVPYEGGRRRHPPCPGS